MAKYDAIGKTYNQTRKADPYITERLLRLLNPKTDGIYLDIGCGSGNYTHEFAKRRYQFIGIDPSSEMLQKAEKRASTIEWKQGTVEAIPLDDLSIDGVLATLTMHHWHDLGKGFQELGRVLKPGSPIVMLTATPEQMQAYWLIHYFPKMINDSLKLMPKVDVISEAMKKGTIEIVQMEAYFVKNDLEDLFLQCGKNNPELYFKPEVRAGISSFAAVANKEEVDSGLQKLRRDIDSGEIHKIITSYNDNLGDYLFIMAKKI
jgi:ubiquinone/menaquinone biosynthesis C-methylase UbiE